jgi:endonuclease/exonuclease/phosphatase family metal-dependent hydrolase
MTEVKVATLNLFNLMGGWDRRAPLVVEQLAELSPDVIGFQEIGLGSDQGVWIARQVNERMGDRPQYRIKHAASPGRHASAQAIGTLSRLDFLEHEILDLMSHDCTAQRTVLRAEGAEFCLVNTHLHYPVEAEDERVRQIERLLAWLDSRPERLPTVLLGDFNTYVHEKGVALLKSRLRSAHETVHGAEPEKTWPTPVNTWDSSPPGTLDYVYVSPEFQVLEAGLAFNRPSADDPDLFPSDHLGVYAVLSL